MAAKIYIECWEIRYTQLVGATQFGATPRMGTALAGHTLCTAAETAKAFNWSYFLVFVDLTNAFDRLVRETIMGWSDDTEPQEQNGQLLNAGLSEGQALEIERCLDASGPALAQVGASPTAIDLLRSLHSGAWFQIGMGSNPVVTQRGGRQGCKLGPLVFNCGYELPLACVRRKLQVSGLGMQLSGGCPFLVLITLICPDIGAGS